MESYRITVSQNPIILTENKALTLIESYGLKLTADYDWNYVKMSLDGPNGYTYKRKMKFFSAKTIELVKTFKELFSLDRFTIEQLKKYSKDDYGSLDKSLAQSVVEDGVEIANTLEKICNELDEIYN